MSFPKGNIWQDIRATVLGSIPTGSQFSHSRPKTLARWRSEGYFSVISQTTSQYNVETDIRSFSSALLGDIEYLLDHATEHQITIWNAVNANQWQSPAWFVVTFYYWSFFLNLAFTRLIGNTYWFLDKDAAKALSKMAPSNARTLGAGTFNISCGNDISATVREICIKKVDGRIHDASWKMFFSLCDNYSRTHNSFKESSLEDRLFTALVRTKNILGGEWPSALRNLVNYRPGFAYDSVRSNNILGSNYFINTQPQSIDIIINRFESNAAALRTDSDLVTNPRLVYHLLVDLSFIMHSAVTEMHNELISRNNLDTRWRTNRILFASTNGLKIQNTIWPC